MQMNRHLLAQTGSRRIHEGHTVWMARTLSIPVRSPAASDHNILLVLPLPDLSNGLLSVGGSNAASISYNVSRPRHHRLSLRLIDYGNSRLECARRPAADRCEIIIATDLRLPIVVHEVVPWQVPDRFAEMALRGVVLENAADMAPGVFIPVGKSRSGEEGEAEG
jgi:hypothetical protein